MFTSKGLFSRVTCPFNGECVLPKCLFNHPAPSLLTESEVSTPEVLSSPMNEADGGQGGQRKRRKLAVNDSAQDFGLGVGESVLDFRSTVPKKTPEIKTTSKLSSANRDVSPPPLRRSAPSGSGTTTPQPKKNVSAKVKPSLKPAKVEELNPRLLKKSPASHELRLQLLKALHQQLTIKNYELARDTNAEECHFVLSSQQLIGMALDIEEKAATEKAAIYSNVVKNMILAYKRMTLDDWKAERKKEFDAIRILESEAAKTVVRTASPKPVETGLTSDQELQLLPKLFTPLDGLTKYGYVTKIPDPQSIAQAQKGVEAAQGWEVCDRCKARFQVFPGRRESDGALASGGTCTYHWGKQYLQDRPGNDPKAKREKKFRCCGEMVGDSAGCTQATTHVFKVSEVKRLAALLNFETTPENDAASNQPVCIDGEMGYTVYGLELIRLTATSWPSGAEILDVLVRPMGEILDLNSRWSGVSPEQMSDALPYTTSPTPHNNKSNPVLEIVPSPAAARTLLFQHLRPSTPLIGHGLENDLNASRVVHPTVIDTALLFPHKAGLPYRNGLKMLVHEHLGREIQNAVDQGVGHDSKEDANAAGDLVRWRLREEWRKMQRAGWALNEAGEFVRRELSTGKMVVGGLTEEFLERAAGAEHEREIMVGEVDMTGF